VTVVICGIGVGQLARQGGRPASPSGPRPET
jgi:hypothetical protein